MRTLTALLAVAFLFLLSLHAAQNGAPAIDERKMLADLERFLASPAGADAELRKAVLAHAEAHPDATIVIDAGVAFWMLDEKPYAGRDVVLLGYIAGSLRAQLESRVWRDDPYCGLLQVARVYRALKERDPKLAHEGFDQLAREHADGKLAARAAKIEAERARSVGTK